MREIFTEIVTLDFHSFAQNGLGRWHSRKKWNVQRLHANVPERLSHLMCLQDTGRVMVLENTQMFRPTPHWTIALSFNATAWSCSPPLGKDCHPATRAQLIWLEFTTLCWYYSCTGGFNNIHWTSKFRQTAAFGDVTKKCERFWMTFHLQDKNSSFCFTVRK